LTFALCATVGAGACSGSISGGGETGGDGQPCRPDGSCQPGLSCQGGTCRPEAHDPCFVANGFCDPNATCSSATGSVVCTCRAGFTGTGFTCADVDECATDNGGCADDATCTNTPGGRTCTCPAGFAGDGVTCTDIDECLVDNGGCDPHANCTNVPGARACACLPGWIGDGLACVADTDVCRGAPATGRCYSSTQIEWCVAGTGGNFRSVTDCTPGYQCVDSPAGPSCNYVGPCTPGQSLCGTGAEIFQCQSGGTWQSFTCPAPCRKMAIGGYCPWTGATRTLTGTFQYEARFPNADFTDWAPPVAVGGPAFLLVSYHGAEVVDAVTTGAGGAFSVLVPDPPGAEDELVVAAMYVVGDGSGVARFLVADPDLAAGDTAYKPGTDLGASPAVWAWAWRTSSVAAGGTLLVDEAWGSGAARVFDYLRYAYVTGGNRWAGARDPVLAWLGLGVKWSCGACFGPWTTPQFDQSFRWQVFLDGGGDGSYWSDTVTTHELGHWAQYEFGFPAPEAGPHCFGIETMPGQAWLEGWATWFSLDMRSSPVYLSKGQGTMYWSNFATRDAYGGREWVRPEAADPDGVLQRIDEREVSSMMWLLQTEQFLGQAWMDWGMVAPRTTVGPFERGYTRHTWDVGEGCALTNVVDTGTTCPCFADFLDAIRCAGVPAARVDAVTQPGTFFPYPSGAPRCR
jgi:hypothetical protein